MFLLLNCRTVFPHIFCPFIIHYLSGTASFFLCDCHIRSLWCFPIVSKWTLHFVVFVWVIDCPFLWLRCVDCHSFFSNFSVIFSMEMSQIACVTVTQGLFNFVLLFPSIHTTLLIPFKSLIIHSHSCFVSYVTLFLFSSHFLYWSLFPVYSLSGNILLFHSNTFFWAIVDPFSESCCVDYHTFFHLRFTQFLSRTVPLFLSNCYTRF